MIRITAILAVLALFSTGAEARTRHHVAPQFHPECNITMPCIGAPAPSYTVSPSEARADRITRHANFGTAHTRTDKRARWLESRRSGEGVNPAKVRPMGQVALPQIGSGTIRSISGATARVAVSASSKFQCLVSALDNAGYKIDEIGGYAYRNIAGTRMLSKHAFGNAIDINQVARNVVTRRFPAGVNGMASSCGLFHGAQWAYADTGHFEIPGGYGRRRHHHTRYARHRHPHYASAVR